MDEPGAVTAGKSHDEILLMRITLLALPILLAPLALQDSPKKVVDPVKVGEAAPIIRLNDHTGKAARVGGKSKTWTVLAFYPMAATPG